MKINCSITENYFKEKARMTQVDDEGKCKVGCNKCLFNGINNKKELPCCDFENLYPQEAIATVQKWSDEHPRETILEHFRKVLPYMELFDDSKCCSICPSDIDKRISDYVGCNNGELSCKNCWSRDYEEALKDAQR